MNRLVHQCPLKGQSLNVSDNLTWYQEEWGRGCHSLLSWTSKGCIRTGIPSYCLLWCDFVTFAIFNRRGSSSWKTTLWTSWSIWAGLVYRSIHNQVFFFLNKNAQGKEVRILLRGLSRLLCPTFVTKCLTFFLKMSFFLWFSARKTFCTFESLNSCCFFSIFLHR